jgi:hypothetical protein
MRRSRSGAVLSLAFCCDLLFSALLPAQTLAVIGGTRPEQQLAACIEHLFAADLDRLPGEDHSMTIVILEHQRFLQVKDSFRAHRTKLAFSNLQTRRMYLSSDVFRDFDTTLRCIPHELGHFATQSVYENHAEIAAGRIRKRAREVCILPATPTNSRRLSSQPKTLQPAGDEVLGTPGGGR